MQKRGTGGAVNASTCQKSSRKVWKTQGNLSHLCKFCEKILTHGKDRIRVCLQACSAGRWAMMMGVHEVHGMLPESINPSKRRRLRATVARKDTLSHWQTPLCDACVPGSKHRFNMVQCDKCLPGTFLGSSRSTKCSVS